jgi:hypothetical protein
MINLSGLYSKTPIECSDKHGFCINNETYWDKEGNFDINPNKLGIEEFDRYIKFSSENKHEVEIWTKGVLSVMKMLQKWSK